MNKITIISVLEQKIIMCYFEIHSDKLKFYKTSLFFLFNQDFFLLLI